MRDMTISEIISWCKKHHDCKHCEAYVLCVKYFIGLPKYWKIKIEKEIITYGEEENNT